MTKTQVPEPWLRGTLTDVASVQRAVLHALDLAREDLEKWCSNLSDAELNARPGNLAPVAFHIRHIARSIDRLLTYAEVAAALTRGAMRVRAFNPNQFEESRTVGKKQLPTTVGGLLVHIADHTQRHVGQAITTAKVVLASRN